LRRGTSVVALVDQFFEGGVVVHSLGRPVPLSSGPVVLALRTKAALIPYEGRSTRTGWTVRFLPPTIAAAADPKRQGRSRDLMPELSQVLDRLILGNPAQWLWLHRRWREPQGRHLLK
jgi:KDO2-lipid IV(A) lauroyltransferase